MPRALSRLRWQLTLSHLAAIACTLVSMIGAVVLIGSGWIGFLNSPAHQPVQDAQIVAEWVGGLVTRRQTGDLDTILRTLVEGSLRFAPQYGPPMGRGPEGFGVALQNVRAIAVFGPDGSLLASSNPAGESFSTTDLDAMRSLAVSALQVRRNPYDAGLARTVGPTALGAFPILDPAGSLVGAAVVLVPAADQGVGAPDIWHTLAIFGAASVAVLTAASAFALVSAGLVAYLLSRRLVARLERLGRAVEALAGGDLGARAPASGADEVGQLAGRINVMATDLQRTLGELQAERDRVAGLLDARRQLVASVSHELRTPVATIRGYLEAILRRGGTTSGFHPLPNPPPSRGGGHDGRPHQRRDQDGHLSSSGREELETMERELGRLERLIDELFTLSRAEVGRLALRLEPTDAAGVVQRLVDTLAPLAWAQRRVQVLAEVGPGVALADGERLEQIVSNLLSNAIRHTPPGGIVVAAVLAEGETVRIEVRDTGEGIAPEELPHVFERYYRGSQETGLGGAGLGLALVRELAEAMGGSVEATSVPGEGSCFTVRLARTGDRERARENG